MSGMARRGRPRLVAEMARAFVADRLRDLEPQATLDDLARICVEWEDFIREQHNEALREFAGAAYERVVHLEGAREFKTPDAKSAYQLARDITAVHDGLDDREGWYGAVEALTLARAFLDIHQQLSDLENMLAEHDCNDSECPYHGESDHNLITEDDARAEGL